MSTSDPETLASQPPLSRRERFSRRFAALFQAHGHHLLPAIAAALTLSTTYILLGPVLNRSGDDMYHLMNEWVLAHAFRAGDDPFGPLGIEFNQPVLRFYQSLFYLHNVIWHVLTGLDIRFLHNLTIVVCFAASPFAYAYFLRRLGLSRWVAALGGFLSMISIAAFGNSFEAYHQAGIVTQSMGGLFFPWFMGNFIGMLRGESRVSTTALLFALAFLSHAIMSVFAVFAGALYFLVADVALRRNWKRLAAFGLLGAALVAFWVLPFVAHTSQMRAVPDSIVRGRGVHWFTSVSRSELAMVLTTGRLFDDAKTLGKGRVPEDELIDRISIIHTLKTRPPVLTALVGLGCLLALLRLRRTSQRFLLAGLAFSLMLFAGPDDFRFLAHLPFMKQIQTFRCVYLAEFFAFGLAASGVAAVLRFAWGVAVTRRRAWLRRPLLALWILVLTGGLGAIGVEIVLLGRTHLLIRDPADLDRMADALSSLPNGGYPFRVDVSFKGRQKLRHGWLAHYGSQPVCTHWRATGPTAAYHLCTSMGSAARNTNLFSLAGIRYISAEEKNAGSLIDAVDDSGDPQFLRHRNGPDRRGRNNDWHHLLDTGRSHFLRPLVGEPLPVVCSDAQWIWISRSWTSRFRNNLWSEEAPVVMRVPAGTLAGSGLLDAAGTVFYFEHSKLEQDRAALAGFAGDGGRVVTPVGIPGIEGTVLGADAKKGRSPWLALPAEQQRLRSERPPELEREELDPGLERASVTQLFPWRKSFQYYEFDVDALAPVIALLPVSHVPGWRADLDGEPWPAFATGPDMTGVHLPAGAHRLVLWWEMPASHRAAQWVSLAALLVVLASWARGLIRRRRGARSLVP
jgi:hypothetical protein